MKKKKAGLYFTPSSFKVCYFTLTFAAETVKRGKRARGATLDADG